MKNINIPTGILSGTKILVGESNLKSFLREKGFGEDRGSRQDVSLIEGIFLLENMKMQITDGRKYMDFEDLLKIGNDIEENFYSKYLVYKDLRERGLLVRTGLKFGADFRVYKRGSNLGSSHSHYLVHVVPEEYTCSFPELTRAIRLSQNVNKAMIYAIVDEEGDITYYQVERVRP